MLSSTYDSPDAATLTVQELQALTLSSELRPVSPLAPSDPVAESLQNVLFDSLPPSNDTAENGVNDAAYGSDYNSFDDSMNSNTSTIASLTVPNLSLVSADVSPQSSLCPASSAANRRMYRSYQWLQDDITIELEANSKVGLAQRTTVPCF